MSSTYLFGAGVSCPAGIPATNGMVKEIYQRLKETPFVWPQVGEALDLVIAGIRFNKTIADSNPFAEVDVEEIYATLLELSERDANRLAPFIGTWSEKVNAVDQLGLKNRANHVVAQLEHDIQEISRSMSTSNARSTSIHLGGFRKALDDVFRIIDNKADYSNFDQAASYMMAILIKLVWVENTDSITYLKKFIQSSKNEPLWIATLNYDNTIELAAHECGLDCDVGLNNPTIGVRFDEDALIKLAKLHGSVNWSLNENLIIDVRNKPVSNPALIFGLSNKLRVEGPYLDLLLSFRDRLSITKILNIYGYSFRDPHINHLILTWLSRSQDVKICVVDLNLSVNDVLERLESSLGKGRSLFRAPVLDRIEVNNVSIESWLNPC
jgi:hypothetical protein